MKQLKRYWLAALLAVLLVACIVASSLTGNSGQKNAGTKQPSNTPATLVDDRLLQTAHDAASFADSAEGQELARQASRLADHEFDQALASALREAAAPAAPVSGPFKELAERIGQLKTRVAKDQARIAKLTKDDPNAQLELAQAQLQLDQDELGDAQEDLARQGGDKHSQLERALKEHEALQHSAPAQPKSPIAANPATLGEQAMAWFALRDREQLLQASYQQAASHVSALNRQHDTLEKLVNKQQIAEPAPGSADDDNADEEEDTTVMVTRLRHLSDQRKSLTELDKRIQDSQQLTDVYKRWLSLIDSRLHSVVHQMLVSLGLILGILLVVVLIDRAIRHSFGRQTDRRRLHQLRVVATIAVQLIGACLILLVIFGTPNQTSTIIGLATAGLTVVLKDFIVAFFGWFALMGRNGVRVGDWVEIEGVGGEVIEIGLLKTVLLEMGNWTNTGHPTGRRVAFVNKFAIENHYFNFSTAGQWLWDELRMTLPTSSDPYRLALEVRDCVERATEADVIAAQQDWERVTHQYGTRQFSARPAVDLMPSLNGLEVVVRYITRAPQRYEVKSRLFEQIVDLIHKRTSTTAALT